MKFLSPAVTVVAVALGSLLVADVWAAETRRITVLAERPGPEWETFRATLRELGYAEGRSIVLEWRWAEGKNERFPGLAAELVQLRPDVIVTQGTPAAGAARAATSTIPIVMAIAADPVRAGLVQSLARPGGNVTGSSSLAHDLHPKQMQLLKEILPGLNRLGVLYDPGNPMHVPALKEITAAAETLRLQLHLMEARRLTELQQVVSALARERVGALLVVPSPVFDSLDVTNEIARLAAAMRLPAIYNKRHFAEAGGLFVYGARFSDFFRRAAVFVDRILKGAQPRDLPIEQATHFELVVNIKTGRALGVTIPPAVVQRADEVIQ